MIASDFPNYSLRGRADAAARAWGSERVAYPGSAPELAPGGDVPAPAVAVAACATTEPGRTRTVTWLGSLVRPQMLPTVERQPVTSASCSAPCRSLDVDLANQASRITFFFGRQSAVNLSTPETD